MYFAIRPSYVPDVIRSSTEDSVEALSMADALLSKFCSNLALDDGDIPYLSRPLAEGRSLLPAILLYQPPLIMAAVFLGAVTSIASVIRDNMPLADRLLGDAGDEEGRTIAHFASAGGHFARFVAAGPIYGHIFRARSGVRDWNGLLPIHYAACVDSVNDVLELARYCPEYVVARTDETVPHTLLDLALLSGAFRVGKWLLGQAVDWVVLSPAAFPRLALHPPILGDASGLVQYRHDLIEICQLLEATGFVVTTEDHGETVLLRAAREGNLELLRLLHARYRDAFAISDRTAACITACTANQGDVLGHFRDDWTVSLDAEDRDGHSLLWNAVAASAAYAARCCLNLGADPNGLDSAAGLSPRALALEIGDAQLLQLFAPLRYLPQMENAPGDLMISGHVSLLAGSLFSTPTRRGEGKRVFVLEQSERRDALTLDEVIEFLCSVKSLMASDVPGGRTHVFTIGCVSCRLCRFRVHWDAEAGLFHVQVENLCSCCLRGRTPIAPPCQKVHLLLPRVVRSPRLDRHLDIQHPAKVLAKAIFGKVPASLQPYLAGLMHYKRLYRLARARTHAQSLDDVIAVIGGRTKIQTLPNPESGPPLYQLQYRGQGVVTMTWITDWAAPLFTRNCVQYVELDASFYALRPYAYIIPFAVYRNFGIPIGLIVVPTERAEAYQLYDDGVCATGVDPRILHRHPLLSDEGSALSAYAAKNRILQYFCFRHRLELLGSGTYVALLARRLFFTATREEYDLLKAQTLLELDVAMSENMVTKEGIRLFCRFFGLEVRGGRCYALAADPFVEQALWGRRGMSGVGTCSNHAEGTHGRANERTAGRQSLPRRLISVIELILRKAERASKADEVEKSARNQLRKLVVGGSDEEQLDVDGRCPLGCGWDIVYSQRFAIPGFPCRHTARRREAVLQWMRPDLSFIDVRREGEGVVLTSEYTGAPWRCSEERARAQVKIPGEELEGPAPGSGTLKAFVNGMIFEMQTAFPRLSFTKNDLHFRDGRFLADRNDIPEERARFHFSVFRQCAQRKWTTD
jgi:hypothetical protein